MPSRVTRRFDPSRLPAHRALSAHFLFAAIDSLDGAGTVPAADCFRTQVDRMTALCASFANAMATQGRSCEPARRAQLGLPQGEFMGDGARPGADDSWAMDNLRVLLHA